MEFRNDYPPVTRYIHTTELDRCSELRTADSRAAWCINIWAASETEKKRPAKFENIRFSGEAKYFIL